MLRGAVSGAEVVAGSARSAPLFRRSMLDDVTELARRVNAGDLELADGRTAVSLLAATAEAEPADAREALLAREVERIETRMDDLFSNDQSRLLNEALSDRYPSTAPGQYVWVLDFSDTEVIFELDGFADSGLFMLAYAITDGVVVLDPGEPVEVHRVTSYVPDPPEPASGTLTAPEPEQRQPDDAELEREMRRAMERSR